MLKDQTESKLRTVAYRYEDTSYSRGIDEYDDPLPGYQLRVNLHEYTVLKYTPKGIWIDYYGTKKFINLAANKKFACLTKHDALISYRARKARQIKILSAQLERAQVALEMSKEADPSRAYRTFWR